MHPQSNNIGAYITSRMAMDQKKYGAGNLAPAETAGVDFDRTSVRPLHLSTKVQFGYKATLASGHTASFMYGLKHSSDDVTYDDIEGASGSTSLTANDDGSAIYGVAELDVDLMQAKAWLRSRFTPVMSHSGTDVIDVCGIYALGGGELIPPTESDA